MQKIIETTQPAVSKSQNCVTTTHMTAQLSVIGTGKLIAKGAIEGSLDGKGWVTIADFVAQGQGYATDGGSFETLWTFIRANVTSISGTDAVVSVYIAKRG